MEGDRKQETMRPVPVVMKMQEMFYPVRGKIVVGGVKLKDSSENKTNQTVLSIKLYDELDSVIHDVPIAASDSCNKVKGESMTPEEGDNVLVSFINGDFFDPIVTAFLPVANNEIQADSSSSPRSYRKFRGTHESIDKDGNRSVYVAAGDTLEVVGDGDVTIGGKLTITVTGAVTLIADTIKLGASSGLFALIKETFLTLYNAHTHTDSVSGLTTVPVILADDSHKTENVTAK